MAAMLTALYPSQLGLVESPALPGERFAWRERRGQEASTVPRYAQTLAQVLLGAGFKTAAFVNQPALNTMNGFERGFTDWYYPIGPDEIVSLDRSTKHVNQDWAPTLKVAERNDRMLAQKFDQWLGQHDPRDRMFVWLHLLTPHLPYTPNPKFMTDFTATQAPPSDSERYDAEVRAVDDIVGNIVQAIEKHVGLHRALIVFTADHGEAFGEHGMYEHGHTLHDEDRVLGCGAAVRRRAREEGR
jgi:arylsulfatase